MNGTIRKACPKGHPHLAQDYRDPEPPPLAKLKSVKRVRKSSRDEKCSLSPSMVPLQSETILNDQMKMVMPPAVLKVPTSLKEVKKLQEKLLNELPVVTEEQKIVNALSPSDRLLYELASGGFKKASEILDRFIKLDPRILQLHYPDMRDAPRQELSKTIGFLKNIAKILQTAEEYEKSGLKEKEFSLYFHAANSFKTFHTSYRWLSDEFFRLAVEASTGYRKDMGYGEAVIRYVYGRLLLENLCDPEEAIIHLEVAYKIACGKSWYCDPVTGVNNDVIYHQVNYLLHIAYIIIATRKLAKKQYDDVTDLMRRAIMRINETGLHPDIEEANLELVIAFIEMGNLNEATVVLNNVEQSCCRLKQVSLTCSVYLLQALISAKKQNIKKAAKDVRKMTRLAVQHRVYPMVALGFKYIGEYSCKKKDYKKAAKYFHRAYMCYAALDDLKKVDECSILFGYAKSECHFHQFVRLTVTADYCQEDMNALLLWMNEGTPFWELDSDDEEMAAAAAIMAPLFEEIGGGEPDEAISVQSEPVLETLKQRDEQTGPSHTQSGPQGVAASTTSSAQQSALASPNTTTKLELDEPPSASNVENASISTSQSIKSSNSDWTSSSEGNSKPLRGNFFPKEIFDIDVSTSEDEEKGTEEKKKDGKGVRKKSTEEYEVTEDDFIDVSTSEDEEKGNEEKKKSGVDQTKKTSENINDTEDDIVSNDELLAEGDASERSKESELHIEDDPFVVEGSWMEYCLDKFKQGLPVSKVIPFTPSFPVLLWSAEIESDDDFKIATHDPEMFKEYVKELKCKRKIVKKMLAKRRNKEGNKVAYKGDLFKKDMWEKGMTTLKNWYDKYGLGSPFFEQGKGDKKGKNDTSM